MKKNVYYLYRLNFILLLLIPLTELRAQSPNIVISQVYGGGGNSGAPLKNDFVELFNRGATPVSIDNWSIQYASSTGNGLFNPTPLSGTLNPGQYYLLELSSNANVGADLPTPDATGNINMSLSSGKVALVNVAEGLPCNGGSTPCSAEDLAKIVDLIGYGNANFFETAAAPVLDNTTANLRVSDGCTDTDNNSADFVAGAPAPRNSGTALSPCTTPLDLSTTSVDVLCKGAATGSIDLTVSGGTPPFTFEWSNEADTEDLSGLTAGMYTVTVTDGLGQQESTSVTITEPVTAIAVTTSGDETVVVGFGDGCTTISANATGGTGTLTYAWNLGGLSGPEVQVCPAAETTYTVTVTDENSCEATANVTIDVNDVSCGPRDRYVTVCYYGVTQCVREKIAKRYLKLGATLGSCDGFDAARIGTEQKSTEGVLSLAVRAYPNPTTGDLKLQIDAPVSGPARLELLNAAGLPVQQRAEQLSAGTNVVLLDLSRQTTGIYLIRCRDAAGHQAVVRVSRQ